MDERWNRRSSSRWVVSGPRSDGTTFRERSGFSYWYVQDDFLELPIPFITPDVAFVDADITMNDVLGPDGKVHSVLPISAVFTAVRQGNTWFIQDERTHFKNDPSVFYQLEEQTQEFENGDNT